MKKSAQSHNLTRRELLDLQRSNALGEDPKTISANVRKSAKIKETEQHMVHLELENKNYDRVTGRKTSTPFVQTFYPDEFDRMKKDNAFAGLSVEVIHDPRSGKEQKGKNSGQRDTKEKTVSQMNKAELQAKYKEVFGDEESEGFEDLNIQELKDSINERLEFLEAEKKDQEEN